MYPLANVTYFKKINVPFPKFPFPSEALGFSVVAVLKNKERFQTPALDSWKPSSGKSGDNPSEVVLLVV